MSTTHTTSLRQARKTALTGCVAAVLATISAAESTTYFRVTLNGQQANPPNRSRATGTGMMVLDASSHELRFALDVTDLGSIDTAAHLHGFTFNGGEAPVMFDLPLGTPKHGCVTTTLSDEVLLRLELTHVNVHTARFPGGEISGPLLVTPTPRPLAIGWGAGERLPVARGGEPAIGCGLGGMNPLQLTRGLHAALVPEFGVDAPASLARSLECAMPRP